MMPLQAIRIIQGHFALQLAKQKPHDKGVAKAPVQAIIANAESESRRNS